MVGAGVCGQINGAPKASTLGIVGSVNHLADTGLHQRPCTHRAGFQRHDQGALIQSPIAQDQGRLAQSHQFRMPERI